MTSSPFRIQDFWSVATPGTTLCLLDGTYQGASNMIAPAAQGAAAGLSGTKSSRITIRALNDGAVLIDGSFLRTPLNLDSNHWFVIEGVNFRNGGSTMVLRSGGNHILRRLVAWDASFIGNGAVLYLIKSNGNLIEDVALFGTGRELLMNYRGSDNVARRLWARWEGSSSGNAKRGVTLAYDNSPGMICENCFVTWSAESMPREYDLASSGQGATAGQRFLNWAVHARRGVLQYGTPSVFTDLNGTGIYGSLAYLMPANGSQPSGRGNDHPGEMIRQNRQSNVYYKHVMAFIPPVHASFNSVRGFGIFTASDTVNVSLSNITSTRGSLGDALSGTGVTVSASTFGTSLTVDPWTNTRAGVNLCHRWVNKQPTTQPLWPWPMENRIRSATGMARSAFDFGNPCLNCVGMPARRIETSVTGQMEALFGPIPSTCRTH